MRVEGGVQLHPYAKLVLKSFSWNTPDLFSVQEPEANSKPSASREDFKTPLVQHKALKQDDGAYSSLSDNLCTGITLVTPMDQQLAMQRSVHL